MTYETVAQGYRAGIEGALASYYLARFEKGKTEYSSRTANAKARAEYKLYGQKWSDETLYQFMTIISECAQWSEIGDEARNDLLQAYHAVKDDPSKTAKELALVEAIGVNSAMARQIDATARLLDSVSA